jgi:hypothetical protein
MPGRDLQPTPGSHQERSGEEITPLQLSSWIRLWSILLAPVDSQSAGTVNECAAKPEPATPLRRQPKRLGADEPSQPRKQQRLGSHPEPSDGPR